MGIIMRSVADLMRRCFLAKEGGRVYRQEYQEQEWEDQVWEERIWEDQVWGETRTYFDRRKEGGLESKWKELDTLKVERVPGCLGKMDVQSTKLQASVN